MPCLHCCSFVRVPALETLVFCWLSDAHPWHVQVHEGNNFVARSGWLGVAATADARAPRDVRGQQLTVRWAVSHWSVTIPDRQVYWLHRRRDTCGNTKHRTASAPVPGGSPGLSCPMLCNHCKACMALFGLLTPFSTHVRLAPCSAHQSRLHASFAKSALGPSHQICPLQLHCSACKLTVSCACCRFDITDQRPRSQAARAPSSDPVSLYTVAVKLEVGLPRVCNCVYEHGCNRCVSTQPCPSFEPKSTSKNMLAASGHTSTCAVSSLICFSLLQTDACTDVPGSCPRGWEPAT